MELFTIENLISLLTLALLEVVLGIDNVIFVSIVMGRLDDAGKQRARRIWMIAGIAVRVALLMGLRWLVNNGNAELFQVFGKSFNIRSLVMLAGGFFLLYKTVKEIHEKLEGDEHGSDENFGKKAPASFGAVITQIILIDTVFSFDSIITAVGMARNLVVMIIAVVIAMIIMFFFSQKISDFIHKHPTLKMLALSFLVMIGVVLIVEGWDADKAHDLHLKNYVYFAMAFSFGVEILNMVMRKRQNAPLKLREPVIKPKKEEDYSDLAR